jgi:hypothetical protein
MAELVVSEAEGAAILRGTQLCVTRLLRQNLLTSCIQKDLASGGTVYARTSTSGGPFAELHVVSQGAKTAGQVSVEDARNSGFSSVDALLQSLGSPVNILFILKASGL